MLSVLSVTAPIYLLIALGFCAMHQRWMSGAQLEGIGVFVLSFALPSLVFSALAHTSLSELSNPTYLIAYGGGSVLAFMLSYVLSFHFRGQTREASALNGFGASFSNTGFIGYSVLATVIGSSSAAIYFAYNVLIENLIMIPLLLILAEAGQQTGNIAQKITKILLSLLKKPIIIALIIGLIFSISGHPPPTILHTITNMLAAAAAPLALFFIGGSLYGLNIRGSLPDIAQISLGKLLIHPLCVLVLLLVLQAPTEMRFAGLLLAAMPVGSMLPLFGQRYGHQRRCAASLMIATTLSFFTISLVLLWH